MTVINRYEKPAKSRHYRIFTLLLILVQSICIAQNPTQINVFPPSPTSAGLGKYGDIPISLYTGAPQINIPLWTLSEHDASLPISLSYHSNGLKVEEIASWVGLGWSLNAGGVITRSVKGLPDEDDLGYSGFAKIGEKVDRYTKNQLSESEKFEFHSQVSRGIWDSEPDIFYYNFAGRSGKMVLDYDGTPHLIPSQKLKVEGSIEDGWAITTEDGAKFYFNVIETTYRESACELDPPPAFNSSWYLGSIVTPKGYRIDFSYLAGTSMQEIIPAESRYTLFQYAAVCRPITNAYCKSILTINTKRLHTIRTQTNGKINTEIVFNSDTKRSDLPLNSDDYRLDNIKIKQNGNLLKEYKLSYLPGVSRLSLGAVQEMSGTVEKPPHKFEYYNLSALPPLTAKAQDHWGYFNSNSSSTLVPRSSFVTPNGNTVSLDGADRSPDFGKAKTGVLNKITYPTAGYTLFEHEPHDYGYLQNQPVEGRIVAARKQFASASVEEPTSSATFTIEFEQFVEFYYAVNIGEEVGLYPDNGEYISIKNLSESAPFFTAVSGDGISHSFIQHLQPGVYEITAHSESTLTKTSVSASYQEVTATPKFKSAGGVRVKTVTHYDGFNANNVQVKTYKYRMGSDNDRSSGVLIAEPRYSYYYTKMAPISDQVSEGECVFYVRTALSNLMGTTQGSHIGYREVVEDSGENGKKVYRFTSPFDYTSTVSPGYPFASATSYDFKMGHQTLSVDLAKKVEGYQQVRKDSLSYVFEENFNHKTVPGIKVGYTKRSSIYPNAVDFNTFSPQPYEHISSWFYQSNAYQETFDENNLNKGISSDTRYFYDNPVHQQLTRTETSIGNRKRIKKLTYPADYSDAEAGPIVGDMKTERHMHNAPITISTIESIDGVERVLDKQVIKYGEFDNPLGWNERSNYLPEEVFSLEADEPLSLVELGNYYPSAPLDPLKFGKQISFDYSDFGAIKQSSRENDSPTSYIWGYNNTLPIARIENIDYEDLLHALANPNQISFKDASGNTLSDGALQAAFDVLRLRIPEAMITSYTYNQGKGVSSVTDANGLTTHYGYDDLGRLNEIRDSFENILQLNIYQYKGHDNQ